MEKREKKKKRVRKRRAKGIEERENEDGEKERGSNFWARRRCGTNLCLKLVSW